MALHPLFLFFTTANTALRTVPFLLQCKCKYKLFWKPLLVAVFREALDTRTSQLGQEIKATSLFSHLHTPDDSLCNAKHVEAPIRCSSYPFSSTNDHPTQCNLENIWINERLTFESEFLFYSSKVGLQKFWGCVVKITTYYQGISSFSPRFQ